MMTSEMIAKLNGLGKEWHKGSMHRFYIDLTKASDLYFSIDETEHARIPLNRYERSNGKLWIDLDTGKVETKGISDAEGAVACIMELVNI